MSGKIAQTRKILKDTIKELCSASWMFVRNPEKDFTRNRKISFQDILLFFLCKEGGNLTMAHNRGITIDEVFCNKAGITTTLHSYEFDGSAGFAKMQSIMPAFRGDIKEFGGKKIVKLLDYAPGLDGLPKSDVLKFLLEDNCSIVVRPSGTEPKLKTYISVSAENKETAEKVEAEIVKDAEKFIKARYAGQKAVKNNLY